MLYTWPDPLDVGGSFGSITGLLYYSYGTFKIEPRDAGGLVNYSEPLCDADACVDDLVAGDDASPAWLSGTVGAGESWSLDPTAVDVTSNDDSANWCPATTALGSTGDYGTPGAGNDTCH